VSQPISPQHPAVVLRSHYVHLRTLLAIAMVAVVGLAVAVVVLASRDTSTPAAAQPAPIVAPASIPGAWPGTRYDGGPDEGTRGPSANEKPTGAAAYNGPH
jgi:hypothetical protein